MLTLLLGTDWVENRREILSKISAQVKKHRSDIVLMVPELISHDTERRLCRAAGDTCSRFAEVLTFTRLAKRVSDAAGKGCPLCLDGGGRVVAMASAVRQLRSRLKAYASVETKPEFLTGLVDAVDEFKRCCISPDMLRSAAEKTEGAFSQKLEELSLILDSYDAICARGKRDPRDQMTWVLEQLEDCSFGEDHIFYIDGFPDFTRQHLAVLEHFIGRSQEVTVSLNCDRIDTDRLAFEKAAATARQLIGAARKQGQTVEIITVSGREQQLAALSQYLFQGNPEDFGTPCTGLSVFRADSQYDECLMTAQRIMEYVQQGDRYRDMSIVCGNLSDYRIILPSVLKKCGIPCYISGTEDILDKPVISTVLYALECALSGFSQKEVLEYLKSALSPLELYQSDELENYGILWNITGKKWLEPWKNHPIGLGKEWTEAASAKLQELNGWRAMAIDPLAHLAEGFHNAEKLADLVSALYQFLDELSFPDRLEALSREMEQRGDNRSAQILNQLWEILLGALEQLYDVLGDMAWEGETFTRLLRLLLSQYDVGTIPPVLDTVTAGSVSAMRCQQPKHLFVLGAQEGSLPGYGGTGGILTDGERDALRALGVTLTGGSVEGLQAEFAEIYGVFCGASQSIHISCPAAEPSFLYRRMEQLAGGEPPALNPIVTTDPYEAAAWLCREKKPQLAERLGIGQAYHELMEKKSHDLGMVCRKNIEKLYGKCLHLSASQIDKQADCRLAYFLKYGLKAKERKPVTVDPAEFGTYVHAVLEKTGQEVMRLGGFHQVTLEQIQSIAGGYSDAYAEERFSEIDSKRLSYLFRKNTQELAMVVEELWEEMEESRFSPVGFEVGFDEGELIPLIPIPGSQMDAVLRGFVDRVDAWQEDGQNYFRVVDYKTGKKRFDYCDVFNGLGLQMLLYLFALSEAGENLLGEHPIPAGVQYFPARAPFMLTDGILTDEEAREQRAKEWKRDGLLLEDSEVLDAMDPDQNSKRLCCARKKDGSLSGNLADRTQMKLLRGYVWHILGKMVDEIASGRISPNPYTRGSSHNACAYCPYGGICHPEDLPERRNYQAMTRQKFWDDIEKEMEKDGR